MQPSSWARRLRKKPKLIGRYTFECFDKDGKLKWTEVIDNTVVTVGKNLALDTFLAGSAYTVTGTISGIDFIHLIHRDFRCGHHDEPCGLAGGRERQHADLYRTSKDGGIQRGLWRIESIIGRAEFRHYRDGHDQGRLHDLRYRCAEHD